MLSKPAKGGVPSDKLDAVGCTGIMNDKLESKPECLVSSLASVFVLKLLMLVGCTDGLSESRRKLGETDRRRVYIEFWHVQRSGGFQNNEMRDCTNMTKFYIDEEQTCVMDYIAWVSVLECASND
jgi:hypothetical protein